MNEASGSSRRSEVGKCFWKIFGIHFKVEGRSEQSVTREEPGVHGTELSNRGKYYLYN